MEKQDGTGCHRGESEELCRAPPRATPCENIAVLWHGWFRGRQQTPPNLWGVGAAEQRGDVCSKSLELLLKPEPLAREEGLAGEVGSFPAGAASLLSLPAERLPLLCA